MAEYIERDAIIGKAIDEKCFVFSTQDVVRDEFVVKTCYKNLAEVVYSIPIADVAPVVRCKDCKYSCIDGNGCTCEGYWYELSEYAVPVKDDDFCSFGEPKEG